MDNPVTAVGGAAKRALDLRLILTIFFVFIILSAVAELFPIAGALMNNPIATIKNLFNRNQA